MQPPDLSGYGFAGLFHSGDNIPLKQIQRLFFERHRGLDRCLGSGDVALNEFLLYLEGDCQARPVQLLPPL